MNRIFTSRRLLIICILFLACSLGVIGCDVDKTSVSKRNYKIALLQLGTHPVIDTVISGFESRVNQIYGNKATIKKYNGNFDMNTLGILAKQMVASDTDILISVTTPATGLLVGANRGTHPLVFTFVSDPNAIGYTRPKSLKNTTGLSDQVDYTRTLKMIRMFKPTAKKIGYLLTRSEGNAVTIHKGFESAAHGEGFEIITATIGQALDIRVAAETLAPNVDIFLFGGDNTIASGIDVLISTAKGRNLPIFACDEQSVERGALASYSVDYRAMGERTAEIVGLVLSGAIADDIPMEVYTGSKLIVNEKAAKDFGIKIPLAISQNAYRIIKE